MGDRNVNFSVYTKDIIKALSTCMSSNTQSRRHSKIKTPTYSKFSRIEPGVVMHAFNPRTSEAEASESLRVQGQLNLCSEFQDSQGYIGKINIVIMVTSSKAI